ncbi:hypothetical protein D3C86_1208370 [compost metagenome]
MTPEIVVLDIHQDLRHLFHPLLSHPFRDVDVVEPCPSQYSTGVVHIERLPDRTLTALNAFKVISVGRHRFDVSQCLDGGLVVVDDHYRLNLTRPDSRQLLYSQRQVYKDQVTPGHSIRETLTVLIRQIDSSVLEDFTCSPSGCDAVVATAVIQHYIFSHGIP